MFHFSLCSSNCNLHISCRSVHLSWKGAVTPWFIDLPPRRMVKMAQKYRCISYLTISTAIIFVIFPEPLVFKIMFLYLLNIFFGLESWDFPLNFFSSAFLLSRAIHWKQMKLYQWPCVFMTDRGLWSYICNYSSEYHGKKGVRRGIFSETHHLLSISHFGHFLQDVPSRAKQCHRKGRPVTRKHAFVGAINCCKKYNVTCELV